MYTIFSIDFENNPLRLSIFKAFLAECAMRGAVVPIIGSYKGQTEHSFLCRRDDFEAYIRGTAFMQGQESVLHVASGNKMETTLEYLDGRPSEFLGCMQQVTYEEAMTHDSWSYRPDINIYWVAKPGNPDRVRAPRSDWANGYHTGYRVGAQHRPENIAAE